MMAAARVARTRLLKRKYFKLPARQLRTAPCATASQQPVSI